MRFRAIARPTATTAIAAGALVVALGGSAAVASGALQKGDNLIKKNSLSANRIRNHTIGATQVKPVVWHSLQATNGWVVYDGGTYSGSPEYTKDAQGFVHLRGAIDGTAKTSDVFATLPAGFRPVEENAWLPVASTNNASDPQRVGIDVLHTGEIAVEGTGGADFAYVSLAGVEFYAG